tara:strand:+ start:669 stop:950 length:282 start_codon:yes stop_codon:yes gene_type:complete
MSEKLEENVHYELVPGNTDHWDIRILKGDYIETVFNFGAIKVTENDELRYNTEIKHSTFDEDYSYDSDLEWHNLTGNILISIIEQSIENKNNS